MENYQDNTDKWDSNTTRPMNDAIEEFMELFQGRTDAYGTWEGGSKKEPTNYSSFARHLYNEELIGIYPLRDDNTVKWGCSDIDINDIDLARNLQLALQIQNVPAFIEKTVKGFYKNYSYNARKPYFIDENLLTNEQKRKLTESETFCMMPWVHMHAFPDGRAYPCCLADYWHPVGDLRKNTMEEVWNQDKYKDMRKNMMAGKECKECTKCYEQEDNGFFSMRK